MADDVVKGPYVIVMKPGIYYWCSCGATKTPPFCDMSQGSGCKPLKVEIERERPVVWCGCGQSKDKPFCDGSHPPVKTEPELKVNMRREPYLMVMKPGEYHWCSCGGTRTPPFCDGTHKMPVKKVAFKTTMKGPYVLVLKPGTYYWCACGRTKTPPFCDGSHKATKKKPVKFAVLVEHPVVLCGCRGTKNPPFCDGSHTTKKK